jgi:hypothetical protein
MRYEESLAGLASRPEMRRSKDTSMWTSLNRVWGEMGELGGHRP